MKTTKLSLIMIVTICSIGFQAIKSAVNDFKCFAEWPSVSYTFEKIEKSEATGTGHAKKETKIIATYTVVGERHIYRRWQEKGCGPFGIGTRCDEIKACGSRDRAERFAKIKFMEKAKTIVDVDSPQEFSESDKQYIMEQLWQKAVANLNYGCQDSDKCQTYPREQIQNTFPYFE